jgi:hypothetical protein
MIHRGVGDVQASVETAASASRRLLSFAQDPSLAGDPRQASRYVQELEDFVDGYRRGKGLIEQGIEDKLTAAKGSRSVIEEAAAHTHMIALRLTETESAPEDPEALRADEAASAEPAFTEAYLTDSPDVPADLYGEKVAQVATTRAVQGFGEAYDRMDDVCRTVNRSSSVLEGLPTDGKLAGVVEEIRTAITVMQRNPRAAYQLEDELRRFRGNLRTIEEGAKHINSHDAQTVQQAEQARAVLDTLRDTIFV